MGCKVCIDECIVLMIVPLWYSTSLIMLCVWIVWCSLFSNTQVWCQYPTQLVGFPARVHRWEETTQKWLYDSQWLSNISMVLTGAAFYHKVGYVLPSTSWIIADKSISTCDNCDKTDGSLHKCMLATVHLMNLLPSHLELVGGFIWQHLCMQYINCSLFTPPLHSTTISCLQMGFLQQ